MAGQRMRRVVVVIGALLATGVLAASAAGEHNVLELISTGPAGGNGAADSEFRGASSDGARVFFDTDESLVSADTDTRLDVYERSGGQTTLISTGPAGGNGDFGAGFVGRVGRRGTRHLRDKRVAGQRRHRHAVRRL